MSHALPCVLLRFEGPGSWDLFRDCIESMARREAIHTHWITNAVLPVDTEASEGYVWTLIGRRLGERNARHGLQLLLHRYSRSRMLAAITGHPSLASDASLIRLIDSALAAYADALGMPRRPMTQKHPIHLGTPLLLPGVDWSWRGLTYISDEVLRLIAACYICLHLFSGYQDISMDILEPSRAPEGPDEILTLSLAVNGDRPIRSVEQSLRALRDEQGMVSRGTTLKSLGIVVGRAAEPAGNTFRIGDLSVWVEARQRVAPWEVKLSLPSAGSDDPPRIDSTAPLDTAAALLRHVYDSLDSAPDIPISNVTIYRETRNLEALSLAAQGK